MDGSRPITVALVDNHEQVLHGLKLSLQVWSEIEVVGTASDIEDGCQLCQQVTPQVLITNKVMTNEDGGNLIREVLRVSPSTQVFILGDFYELELIEAALDAGARGYILKQTSTLENIVKAIKAITLGTWVFCREVYALLPDKTDYLPHLITNPDFNQQHPNAPITE